MSPKGETEENIKLAATTVNRIQGRSGDNASLITTVRTFVFVSLKCLVSSCVATCLQRQQAGSLVLYSKDYFRALCA